MAVLAYVVMGSSVARRSLSRITASLAVLDFAYVAASLSLRGVGRIGSSMSVVGLGRLGSVFSLSVIDFTHLGSSTGGTGQTVRAVAGDLMYFLKGSKLTFDTQTGGLGYFVGQRLADAA